MEDYLTLIKYIVMAIGPVGVYVLLTNERSIVFRLLTNRNGSYKKLHDGEVIKVLKGIAETQNKQVSLSEQMVPLLRNIHDSQIKDKAYREGLRDAGISGP